MRFSNGICSTWFNILQVSVTKVSIQSYLDWLHSVVVRQAVTPEISQCSVCCVLPQANPHLNFPFQLLASLIPLVLILGMMLILYFCCMTVWIRVLCNSWAF